jgi:hypothetical protein
MSGSIHTVCPYFTMFPLDFPHRVLKRHASEGEWVLDPFCGRGTTNFAARLLGLPTVGLDSSPVAAAIAEAKLPRVEASAIRRCARDILLGNDGDDAAVPVGEFWRHAYHEQTLCHLSRLRESLLRRCESDTRVVLRAIILGTLHGPRTKGDPSYFSNQCPRTFAPKPDYAIGFWKKRRLRPPRVDVLDVIARRAKYLLAEQPTSARGRIRRADSRLRSSFGRTKRFKWVVTSPPYYGMRTYVIDQWIRNWFLGGRSAVPYEHPTDSVVHTSPDDFANDLQRVWKNAASVAKSGARLIVRFGAIHDRNRPALDILRRSLDETGWRISTIRHAGSVPRGRRQADQFKCAAKRALDEHDVYARLDA